MSLEPRNWVRCARVNSSSMLASSGRRHIGIVPGDHEIPPPERPPEDIARDDGAAIDAFQRIDAILRPALIREHHPAFALRMRSLPFNRLGDPSLALRVDPGAHALDLRVASARESGASHGPHRALGREWPLRPSPPTIIRLFPEWHSHAR